MFLELKVFLNSELRSILALPCLKQTNPSLLSRKTDKLDPFSLNLILIFSDEARAVQIKFGLDWAN